MIDRLIALYAVLKVLMSSPHELPLLECIFVTSISYYSVLSCIVLLSMRVFKVSFDSLVHVVKIIDINFSGDKISFLSFIQPQRIFGYVSEHLDMYLKKKECSHQLTLPIRILLDVLIGSSYKSSIAEETI